MDESDPPCKAAAKPKQKCFAQPNSTFSGSLSEYIPAPVYTSVRDPFEQRSYHGTVLVGATSYDTWRIF